MFVAYVQEGKNILWWLKIVVTNIVFWNCMTFNFYQTNIKKVFVNYTQNKVIQLPNNAIVRSSNYILNFYIKWLNNIFVKNKYSINILQSANIFFKWLK